MKAIAMRGVAALLSTATEIEHHALAALSRKEGSDRRPVDLWRCYEIHRIIE